MTQRILVTGGAGYIGSHTTLALLQAGFEVVVLDNLCNSSAKSLERVAEIAGRAPTFICGDVRDRAQLDRLFAEHPISAVLHFAGLKAVGESVADPLRYYDVNVCGAVTLCQAMQAAGVFSLVFSSSATVYGDPTRVPIDEDQPVGQPANPYGRSKLMVEQILADLAAANGAWPCCASPHCPAFSNRYSRCGSHDRLRRHCGFGPAAKTPACPDGAPRQRAENPLWRYRHRKHGGGDRPRLR